MEPRGCGRLEHQEKAATPSPKGIDVCIRHTKSEGRHVCVYPPARSAVCDARKYDSSVTDEVTKNIAVDACYISDACKAEWVVSMPFTCVLLAAWSVQAEVIVSSPDLIGPDGFSIIDPTNKQHATTIPRLPSSTSVLRGG